MTNRWAAAVIFWCRISSLFRHSSLVIRHFPHHDLGADSAIVSRFLPRETAYHCALVVAFARCAESAFHERRHEPVRADFSGTAKAVMEPAARRRHAEMHSRRW